MLSGNFPIALLNLTKLSYLSLSYNQFTGTLPPDINSLPNLENFEARQNSFVGTIPSTLLTIPSLRIIDLADNQLNGTLGFVNMLSSPPLDFDNNSLSGLYLSNNRFTGQVPGWLWSLPNLNNLDLSDNRFSQFEGFAKDFSTNVIGVLDLRSNDFQGPLFVPPIPVAILLASRNNFSGEIPTSICDMTTSLDILDIADNNLNGSAPECFWNLTAKSLSVLDIGDNHFTGSLPDIFKNATNLRSLNLGHNHFVGKLPKSLTSCSSLEVLNVEHNRFNDTFPFWLQSLKNLQVLILRSNEFHGPLQYHPQGPSWFPQLRIIDLSHNDFTGTLLSDFFIHLTAMSSKGDSPKLKYIGGNSYYRDSMVLMNKGVELEYTRIFTLLTAIDFSGNKLRGKIPDSIGQLEDLIVLNLSSNGFDGNIPSSLGKLTQLESLDLSRNELSGEIPPTLRDLTKLSFVKVSHNELVGPIPQSTQFQTQSASSFEGNRGLCGPPLNEMCGVVDTEPSEEEEEEDNVISWIAAAIGLAPGIIFGVTIGHIVMTRKPQWFMVKKKKKTQRIALGRFASESTTK
ncbi:hypothetical protein Bca4012_059652 [Brassica carinata]